MAILEVLSYDGWLSAINLWVVNTESFRIMKIVAECVFWLVTFTAALFSMVVQW
jgi:hypothetical protein